MSTVAHAVQMDNSGKGPLMVPGFGGLPINYTLPPGDRFAHGVHDYQQTPAVTAREMAMTRAMGCIVDKPGWHKNVFDEATIATWKSEAQDQDRLISDKAWNWCIAELRDKAIEYEKCRFVRVVDTGSCACVADELLPISLASELQQELHAGGKPLLPNGGKFESVDSCLYPLVLGQTLVYDRGGTVELEHFSPSDLPPKEKGDREGVKLHAETSPILGFAFEDDETGDSDPWVYYCHSWRHMPYPRGFSQSYQRLPCEVEFVGDSGTDVKITSYINNLHPCNTSIYQALEKIISASIAPWNACLVRCASNYSGEMQRGRIPLRIVTYGAKWNATPPEINRRKRYSWEHPQPGTAFSYEDWKVGHNIDKAVVKMVAQRLRSDKITAGPSHERYEIRLEKAFRESGLQVIIQIESTELPENQVRSSTYDWHLNGLQNEHVVAKSIYVYDASNVGSRIRFRQETPMQSYVHRYEADRKPDICQNDDETDFQFRNLGHVTELEALALLYGFDNCKALDTCLHETAECFQEIGSVELRTGRLITFPNTIESRIEVELLPDSNAGHLRFITIWLVDPNYRICSTRNVPPQQHHWWAHKIPEVLRDTELPQEMIDLIVEESGWSMSENQARIHHTSMIMELNMLYERRHDEVGRYHF